MGVCPSQDDMSSRHTKYTVSMASAGREGDVVIESFHLPQAEWNEEQPLSVTGKAFLMSGWPWSIRECLKQEQAADWIDFVEALPEVLVSEKLSSGSTGLRVGSCVHGYVPSKQVAIIADIKLSS
ncbi:hypothetical protein DIPPA_01888 [Diplonema papillatum]|nr:hypothetical protein DIPPA_01888 [Diplonema papillatum]